LGARPGFLVNVNFSVIVAGTFLCQVLLV